MPRKNLSTKQSLSSNDLEGLITRYAALKENLDELKKECDKYNKDIKTFITELPTVSDGKWEKEVDDIICTVNTTVKKSFRQESFITDERLIKILKDLGIKGVIKRQEYVDIDVLEDAMYKQQIGQEAMLEIDKLREVKETQVLTIKRKKV